MHIQGISKEKSYDDSENNSEDNARLRTRVDVLLGTDFMIPAGVRLDMFHSNAKLPDEVSIPLIKTQAMKDEPEVHYEVSGPSATMNIPTQ
ncbi:Eukaryotic/viral aspartic protease [Phytophthora megakarya]|uniref:Eukaryotic/viral aspartic protease n=1 Tax=Phytophthora megakarya TaxID=4795 RepID=A0A225VJB6_9STRA|nr:Eukaryotic/viral aspartic protease [Phytophthora megakarya]